MMERLFDSLSKIEERLLSIEKTLVRNTIIVEEHERRSDLLEKRQDQLDSKIAPLEAHKSRVDGAMKLAAGIATIIGLVLGLLKLLYKA